MATESVGFRASCPGGCGGDAWWNGVPVTQGGGTSYTLRCINGTCVWNDDDHSNVKPETAAPVRAMTMSDYLTRARQLGRRTA